MGNLQSYLVIRSINKHIVLYHLVTQLVRRSPLVAGEVDWLRWDSWLFDSASHRRGRPWVVGRLPDHSGANMTDRSRQSRRPCTASYMPGRSLSKSSTRGDKFLLVCDCFAVHLQTNTTPSSIDNAIFQPSDQLTTVFLWATGRLLWEMLVVCTQVL